MSDATARAAEIGREHGEAAAGEWLATKACPSCGLPVSLADEAHLEAPYWSCDGPNDRTGESGCWGTVELPTPDLSGEQHANLWASGDLRSLADIPDDDSTPWDAVCDAYEEAFTAAVRETVERECMGE